MKLGIRDIAWIIYRVTNNTNHRKKFLLFQRNKMIVFIKGLIYRYHFLKVLELELGKFFLGGIMVT